MYYVEQRVAEFPKKYGKHPALYEFTKHLWAKNHKCSHIAFETYECAKCFIQNSTAKLLEYVEDYSNNMLCHDAVNKRTVHVPDGTAVEIFGYRWERLVEWHITEHQKQPCRLRISFRTENVRYTYVFDRIADFLDCVQCTGGDKFLTDSSQILTVEDEGNLIYSTFPASTKNEGEQNVNLSDIIAWFSETR